MWLGAWIIVFFMNNILLTRASSLSNYSDKASQNNVCLTPECVRAAARFLDYMDQSIDPCNDFYAFSCGNFLKETVIPEDQTVVNAFQSTHFMLTQRMRKLIEEPINPDEIKPFQLMKQYYKVCMDTKSVEQDGLQTIKEIIKNLGGWPVVEGNKWNVKNFDWKELVYKLKNNDLTNSYFLRLSIEPDFKQSTNRIIMLDEPYLGLSKEFLRKGFKDKWVKAYFKYMVNMAILLGANKYQAYRELKNVLRFQIYLAKISLSREERRDDNLLYNPMTIEEMQKKFPSIPWLEYINNILAPVHQITNHERIIVKSPKYIKKFEKLLEKTRKGIQANYAIWRMVADKYFYLTEKVRDLHFEYSVVVSGKTERTPRWRTCIGDVSERFPLALGSLYVRNYFKENAKEIALEMVEDIRGIFKKILKEIRWMGSGTKRNALAKVDTIYPHIGYPVELLNDKIIEEYYEGLVFNKTNLLKTTLDLKAFYLTKYLNKFREPINKTDWKTHGKATTVNAYYAPVENSIQFPAGILQGIFFSADRPKYMNYGAIGFIIGHEITHGFDDEGCKYDKNGNLVDWWDPRTRKAFIKKSQCIVEQYANYSVPHLNLNLNGINTQGENIADNGGIKEAYLAYQEWVKRNGAELSLPGLLYTPNQMFWISAAATWCSKYRDETLKNRIITGVHSPGEFRVLGPMSNSNYFNKDFNCPVGSRMNPEKKCHVW